jgi:hypothetical protein
MTTVHHWQFHNGIDPVNPGSQWPLVPTRGWTCWVYTSDRAEFEHWMQENCPDSECSYKFNSGNPMYTVRINDDKECMLFKLRWL